MDPVRAAWVAQGRPRLPDGPRRQDGRCARCSVESSLEPTSRVVSDRFTGFDTWSDPSGLGLCAACTWAHRETRLRASAHSVRADPVQLAFLTYDQLAVALSAPVPADLAVVVPLRAGRKHVLPTARFGQVCVDGTCLSWSGDDCRRLEIMHRLRRDGVSYIALREPVPPWRVMRARSPGARMQLLEDWAELDPWRAADPWFDLAVTATTHAGTAS